MQVLFWSCLVLIGYVYFGYPLLVVSGLLGRRKPAGKREILPPVSVIVPAHNEESTIEAKLRNLVALDYPRDRLEILVGSDGSTDGTEEIVKRFSDNRIQLIASSLQRGKSSIQNDLVARSSGQILLFTDADCLLSRETVRCVVKNFADPKVGSVTASPSYDNSEETDVTRNENLYLRYESWLRKQESDRGLLAAASGSLFALRRSLWKPLDPNVGDDFALPLQLVLRGYRNMLEPTAVVRTKLPQIHLHSMLRLKKRIVSKDLRGLLSNKGVLNPLRTGAVAISVWSHKLLRWLVPYFLLGMLVSNLFLFSHSLFWVPLAAQALLFGAALASVLNESRQTRLPWSIALSFCLVNLAALLGTLQCAAGRTSGCWRPTR